MNKGSKIIVTVLLVFGFFFVAILLQAAGTSKTFTALIALGLFYGIRSMWEKPKDNLASEIKLDKERKNDSDLAIKK